MKLRPILRADADLAATLLAEGFPVHSPRTWQESVRRLIAHVEQMGNDSIGQIATVGDRDIGIGLAIPGMRSAYEPEPRKVVNLAAFYLRPGNEWMTTLVLRRMMKDPTVEYVDLTASPQMREVNRKLGFVDRTHGVVVVPTALGAVRPAGRVRIIPFADLPARLVSPAHYELLERHHHLQALSLAVEIDGICHPLILVKSYRKRLVGARIVLARDKELVQAAAGALARYLVRHGVLFFEFDSPSAVPIAGSMFLTRAAPAQTTWPVAGAAIDHTFSELMFIPPPSNQQVLVLPRRRSSSAFPFPFGLVDAAITAAPTTSLVLNLSEMLPV
jgi:hypothetical protein